jgi:hypothetical protein
LTTRTAPGQAVQGHAERLSGRGIWERAGDGYRELDVEAVQVCIDRVRELREQDAWLAGLPRAPGQAPAGAAGTTRFGDRTPNGRAVSFRCGQCGEVAGVVRVTRTDPAGLEPPWDGKHATAGELFMDYFLGTIRHSAAGDVLDAVEALIGQGNVDPAVIREVRWALWDITAFYCPECRLNYCSQDWDTDFVVTPGCRDYITGTCPKGHRHLLG